jgi:hypothetical protein
MMTAVAGSTPKLAWGPRIDLTTLPDLYAPQTVPPYTPPATGIDNLGITSTDTFVVVGKGELKVDFKGYVRVARSQPTTNIWNTSEVFTNLIEMCMRGEAPEVGPIVVTLNPDFLSTGQLSTPFGDEVLEQPAKACRMAVGALFHMPRMGKTLFNKEPITLTIEDVRAIPPAGNPGLGIIHRMLPLFDQDNPDGPPAAYLTALKFAMGTYITETDIEQIKAK